MSEIRTFLKKQIDILNNNNIIYHSIDIQLSWNDVEQKLKKNPIGMPTYKNKKINCNYDSTKNGLIIPLGQKYGGLIGVDVDNKNDTINFFNNLAMDNDFDLNTLAIKTINDGMHYYFKLSEEQQKKLNNFMASTALCFTTIEQKRNIDIKYNNQVFFGPSYLTLNNKIYKYEIETDTEPIILPDFLYTEILKNHLDQGNANKKICNNTLNIEKNQPNIQPEKRKINKENEERLRIYLNCINPKRFDDRNEWLILGAIIYNEFGSFDLFEEYSKKSLKYDKIGCAMLWNSFKDDHNKKVYIKKLIELAEYDTENNRALFTHALINDIFGILDTLYNFGPSDLYMSYLFYNLNKHDFMYDTINETWYAINEYGIYNINKKGDPVKKRMDQCLISAIKKEYIRLFKLITNDADASLSKALFKKYQALVKYCASARNSDNLLSKVKLLYIVDRVYEKMDSINPNLIGFENGVYDLKENIFRNAMPEEYISVTTGYNYKIADSILKKEAMKLFETIFPDQEELKYVLKHISLGLYGANPQEQFFIWIGSGANGKGFLRDIIQIVIGDYYDTMDITYLYKSNIIRADAPNPVMARKKNSRFVVSSEPEGDVVLKSSTIKSLSGNDPQQVRMLYGDSFNYVPKFKLVIQTNNEPVFFGFDGGMKRRATMINFPTKFVENPILFYEKQIDKTLKKKITIDKQYIHEFFEIFVDHYKLYLFEGFKMPSRFEEDTKKFIKNNDPIGEWIESNVEKTNKVKDMVRASYLYNDYIDYMEKDDRGVTQLLFKNTLCTMGITQKKKKDGLYYVGIKLKAYINNDNSDDESNPFD